MLIEKLAGRIDELGADELDHMHIEFVRLQEEDLRKPVQRVTSDHGHEYGLRLPRGTVLLNGDILHRDTHGIVVIQVASTRVIVIAPVSMAQMGRVAHALGNRHMPAQFTTGTDGTAQMIVPDDHTTVAYLQHESVPFAQEERVLDEPFHHAEHTH
ncbi:urease accessory protein [Propionibacterium cyclohexanicum]|uniref:Urease accessory protein UreE n=1 Tax=Propionibacterium cyclohexanicum TaxID=64702 RepID=A0A1H9TYB9_9ACTN|nr:urease accessory protein UreE [Propionibacterium cyclohexanicum]SES02052.1 urease accessory protein [Propionibacterium cyclohexanicum]